jgi:hypothetical protein
MLLSGSMFRHPGTDIPLSQRAIAGLRVLSRVMNGILFLHPRHITVGITAGSILRIMQVILADSTLMPGERDLERAMEPTEFTTTVTDRAIQRLEASAREKTLMTTMLTLTPTLGSSLKRIRSPG